MSRDVSTVDPLTISVFTLSASQESVGKKCAPFLLENLNRSYVKTHYFDIGEFPPVWVDGRDISAYPARYKEAFDTVAASDGVVFILPVYCYTASSVAKAITEILNEALTRKPVGLISVAGTIRSHLAMSDLMKSMMFEQETICFPKHVQIYKTDFTQDGCPDNTAQERLGNFSRDFLDFASALRPYSRQCSNLRTHVSPDVFVEFYIKDVEFHTRLFGDILGFSSSKQLDHWLDLRKHNQRIILNWDNELEDTHPFHGYGNMPKLGAGVETAIVVNDIEGTYRQCRELRGAKLTEIKQQEWGMTDFRIITPEGFYIRITTAPPL